MERRGFFGVIAAAFAGLGLGPSRDGYEESAPPNGNAGGYWDRDLQEMAETWDEVDDNAGRNPYDDLPVWDLSPFLPTDLNTEVPIEQEPDDEGMFLVSHPKPGPHIMRLTFQIPVVLIDSNFGHTRTRLDDWQWVRKSGIDFSKMRPNDSVVFSRYIPGLGMVSGDFVVHRMVPADGTLIVDVQSAGVVTVNSKPQLVRGIDAGGYRW